LRRLQQRLPYLAHQISGKNHWSCSVAPKFPRNPVVLVHGLGGNDQSLGSLAESLRKNNFCPFTFTYGAYSLLSSVGGMKSIDVSKVQIADFIKKVRSRYPFKYLKIDIVGYDEGAFMAMNTAKFGDVASIVGNIVAIAPPTHGTDEGSSAFTTSILSRIKKSGGCRACRELVSKQKAIEKLNDGKPILQAGTTLTVIVSDNDKVITPKASYVDEAGVANIVIQKYYPVNKAKHPDEPKDEDFKALVLKALGENPCWSKTDQEEYTEFKIAYAKYGKGATEYRECLQK